MLVGLLVEDGVMNGVRGRAIAVLDAPMTVPDNRRNSSVVLPSP
jgi:hypothetical protein